MIADLDCVVTSLLEKPRSLSTAMSTDGCGLPTTAGFYAWWVRAGTLPDVPVVPHPIYREFSLLYIGIGPVRASSKQSLRSRVVRNHIRGNIGSSTFRLSLAALLLETLDLRPERQTSKTVLTKPDNDRLSDWQERNLRLTWAEAAAPWGLEGDVIAHLQPPLNLHGNASGSFHSTLRDARARLRAEATGGAA